ncbi:hypothetical protein ACOACQ_05525 [Nocardioides sp. CPCC 206347]|uniref:hypothetical protein n=1 Tax=Nocardioides sp. CPCC 206347 TaxID=3406463 RepID=UPI003B435092
MASVRNTVALAAGAVVVAVGLTACQSSSDTGRVLDERPAGVEGDDLTVRVPSAEIVFTVGSPVDEVDGVDAPGNGAIVPIGWKVTRQPAGPFAGFTAESEVEVVTDEGSIDLVTIDDESGADAAAWVVVPGNGEDVELRVTYDGVAQTVSTGGESEYGAAAAYYDPAADGIDVPCGATVWKREDLLLECRTTAWVLPHAPDSGWADEGSVYAVVQPRLRLERILDATQRLETVFVQDRSTLDGKAPAVALERGDSGTGSVGGVLVAQVPSGGDHVWQASLGFEITEGARKGEAVALEADLPFRGR